jgi:hypothetical protein
VARELDRLANQACQDWVSSEQRGIHNAYGG